MILSQFATALHSVKSAELSPLRSVQPATQSPKKSQLCVTHDTLNFAPIYVGTPVDAMQCSERLFEAPLSLADFELTRA